MTQNERWLSARQVAREFNLSDVQGLNIAKRLGEQDDNGRWRVRADYVYRDRLTRAVGAEKAAMLLQPHDANGDFLQSGTDTVDTTSQITEASPQELTEDQRAANLRQLMDDLDREAAEDRRTSDHRPGRS